MLSLLHGPNLTSLHDSWKNNSFDYMDLCGKLMSLLFNIVSRFLIACHPRSKHLLISWLQLMSTVIFEPKKIKSVTVSTFSQSVCQEVIGLDVMILDFWMLSFKPAFSLSSFILIKRLFSSFLFFALRVRLLIFLLTILIPACESSSPAFCMLWNDSTNALCK